MSGQTEAERKSQWLTDYLDCLPADLRTSPTDGKLIEGARIAYANGWDAGEIAHAVGSRSYAGALYPSLIASQRLAELGATRPQGSGRGFIPRGEYKEAHCGQPGCACRHEEGCDRGWVDRGDTTTPCRVCRPVLHQRVADVPPPGNRNMSDLAWISEGRGKSK